MTLHNDITKNRLQQLAQLQAQGPVVLSVYLDLDPERFAAAPARATEITSLIDTGRRELDSTALDHDQLVQVRADLDRVAEYLRDTGAPSGAHGLAVFCCSSLQLFETLRLPDSVPNSIRWDRTPYIAPLAEMGPPGRWCVTLVNRRVARILRGSESGLTEVASVGDRVHGKHSQGGWSQARYERSVEQDVEAHLRHTAEVLLSQQRRRPFTGLLVAIPQELRGAFESVLHSYVRERLVGYFDVDIETATEDQVTERAAELISEHDRKRVHEKLERLRAELGRDGRAVGGEDGVMSALEQRRVEALLFTQGQLSDELVESAIEAAVAQDADVVAVDGPDLGPLGGIAALLRF